MKKIFLLITFTFVFSVSAWAQGRIAVIPFISGDSDDGSSLATQLSSELTNYYEGFEIIPRTKAMRDIAREKQYQKSGINDTDALARIGRLVKADYVVTGHIKNIVSQNLLVITMIEVATYRQTAGAYYMYTTMDEAKAEIPIIARNMLYYTVHYGKNNAPKLAVLPFDMILKSGTSEIEAEILAQMLLGEIANTGRYNVIQRRSTIEKIMQEEKIEKSRLTSRHFMPIVGEATKADCVLAGFVPKHGSDTLMDVEVFDISSEKQLARGRVEYRNIWEGYELMDDLSYQIVGISAAIHLGQVTHYSSDTNANNNAKNQSTTVTPSSSAASRGSARNVSSSPRSTIRDTSRRVANTADRLDAAYSSAPGSNKEGIEEIKILLSKGNVNAKNKNGWTSLMIASYYGYTDLVKTLIEDGADVNEKNNDGVTALMWSASEGHTEVTRQLINAKADVNARNKNNATALGWATSYGHSQVISILKKAGAK